MTTLLTYGAAMIQSQTTQYMYIEETPPLYIVYVSPEQTNQDDISIDINLLVSGASMSSNML